MRNLRSLLPLWLLLIVASAPIRAEEKGETDKPTDPKVIAKRVAEVREEYDAIKSNQDLNQTRRRRELARRLGTLPHEDSVKILLSVIENDSDLRARIDAMHSLTLIGDIDSVQRMYRTVVKEKKTAKNVLGGYLGSALSKATDGNVPAWIVKKMLGNTYRAKILRGTQMPIRMSAIEALGALRAPEGRAPLLELLTKVEPKRKEIHQRFEILRSLGMIGGDGVQQRLHDAAASEDWRLRLAAADVLAQHFRSEKDLAWMRKLLKDEKPIVREIAARSSGQHKLEPLFPELVVLMREGNLRSKQRSYEALTAISGQDFGYAPDLWAKWWQDKQKGQLTKSGDIKNRKRISVATYYDFKIFSDRVLFVVDVSGSMKWPDYEPHRIDVAKQELVKAIRALDEKTLFNLASFAGHLNMWQKKGEVPANPANKKAALGWIEDALLPRGATNTYSALMDGLAMNPLVDTVYFLSDGIPSTGRKEIPEEILQDLAYANRFRRVIFNTIAIAMGKPSIEKAEKYEDPDEMYMFMKMIADANAGTCVDVRRPFGKLRKDD
ncbi:MAG: HEAT repeat domain-containing protein [Planctomycetota bacterium]|nr:HEAT repeat domain-containing protein [Planctomycetota bacterium]